MDKNEIIKKIIITICLIAVAIVSIFVVSDIASSPKTHEETISKLDEKKITVMELSAVTAGAATAIAAVPGDATGPIANQILEMSSYLLIIIGAIFLEKMLLTLTGYLTFTFLIPIACVLFIIYLYMKKDMLKNIAIKLIAFGIVIITVVPISVKVTELIEETYQQSINQTIESAKNATIEEENVAEENNEENETFWNSITSTAQNVIDNVSDGVSNVIDKAKNLLNNFIDAIAVLLITSCVIPIVVLVFFVWIVKMIFGLNIEVNKLKIKKDKE